MSHIWLNGQAIAAENFNNRAFNYGDGLFETIAVTGGKPRLLALHKERLLADCSKLGIVLAEPAFSRELSSVLTQIEQFTAQPGKPSDGVFKIVVVRKGLARGYATPGNLPPDCYYCWYPGSNPQFVEQSPGQVQLCKLRLARQPQLAGIKHLSRLEQVLARRELGGTVADEGLLTDQQGLLIEGIATNLFLARNGDLLTPNLTNAGVAGVMRRHIIETVAPALGINTRVQPIPLDTLYSADELLLCNSLIGVLPIARVGCFELPSVELGQRLQQYLINQQAN
ncbi:aminodeoxychorismate lyase [Halioxenophilus sp. WMMB6]|uniref:aminodeoxychorismate lyase n=1 Tax=Halioxenophilus sp. WMMB6 TaxID=3073815 RepID=UPI00295EB467|nr:aminodeoxychorismate lyase [Halioxenophilus sp. WMMB6]